MYKEMYYALFGAVTDAMEQMKQNNFGTAAELLVQAQQKCEEIYVDGEGDEEG